MAEKFGCTVEELLERISSEELTEWIAYYQIKIDEAKKEQKKLEAEKKRYGKKGKRRR